MAIPNNRTRRIAWVGEDVWIGTSGGLACARCSGQTRFGDLKNQSGNGTSHGAPVSDAPGVVNERKGRTVPIGILGPRNRTVAIPGRFMPGAGEMGRSDLLACQIAVGHANADGGYRNESLFGVVLGSRGYANYAWGTAEDEYTVLAHHRNVAAMVGYFGTRCRAASAVAMGTDVPVLNVASTPPAVAEQVNPWVFRCHGDVPRQLGLLLSHLMEDRVDVRIGVIRTPGRIAGQHLDWWSAHAATSGHAVAIDMSYDPCVDDLDQVLQILQASDVDTVLTWCDASLSAHLLRGMRDVGMAQRFVGSDALVDESFTDAFKTRGQDPHAGVVIAAYPITTSVRRAVLSDFATRYSDQSVIGGVRRSPSLRAYHSYDATLHLVDAVNRAGNDREAVRRVLSADSQSAVCEAHHERQHRTGGTMFARWTERGWTFHTIQSE